MPAVRVLSYSNCQEIHPLHFQVNFQKFSTLRVNNWTSFNFNCLHRREQTRATYIKLCDESRSSGALILEVGGQYPLALVVTGQTVDTALHQNQTELSISVLQQEGIFRYAWACANEGAKKFVGQQLSAWVVDHVWIRPERWTSCVAGTWEKLSVQANKRTCKHINFYAAERTPCNYSRLSTNIKIKTNHSPFWLQITKSDYVKHAVSLVMAKDHSDLPTRHSAVR